jgi:flagellar assembly factor FliW
MELQTRQFGMLEISEADVLNVPKGLLGFESFERYILIDNPECRPFRWLQCVDTPELAFVVVSPVVFFPEYKVVVHAKEVADIGVNQPGDVEVYVIVTIPEQLEQMSANLQGPILVNRRNNQVKQIVLTDSIYTVQHSIVRQLERNQNVPTGKPVSTVQIS